MRLDIRLSWEVLLDDGGRCGWMLDDGGNMRYMDMGPLRGSRGPTLMSNVFWESLVLPWLSHIV